jgi:hypothetical protein
MLEQGRSDQVVVHRRDGLTLLDRPVLEKRRLVVGLQHERLAEVALREIRYENQYSRERTLGIWSSFSSFFL